MSVFSKITSRQVRLGGEQHSGWLPEGFAAPRPTPVRDVKMTFEIIDDGGANFLLVYFSEDESVHGDTWHQSIDEAKEVAESSFGIRKEEWKDEPIQPPQRNAGSRPSSDGSSASETPSSLGPRG